VKGENNNDGKIIFETRGGETKVIEKKNPVGRPREFASPTPSFYAFNPEAIKTELVTQSQIDQSENTLRWGLDDALPLHILSAIADSPATTACVGKIETYTMGAGFSDAGLMTMPIDASGGTLWDLHCSIVQFFAALDGYALNFKYNLKGKIIQAFNMDVSACRLVAQVGSDKINALKYNPYFGTREYQQDQSKAYHLFNMENVRTEKNLPNYEGQAYFYGTKRTLFKHYPVPKFWAGKKWIYSDAKIATYSEKTLDNGFFESVLMKMIGNPNAMSQHPTAMKEVTGTDGVIRKESYKTEGQVFNEMMGANFSGVEKAAKAMVLWAMNKDQSPSLEAFPTSVNADLLQAMTNIITRQIALSTEVPAILANLPDSTSPLSGQDALKNAVEFMQSNTVAKRNNLENFYNNILLQNFEGAGKAKVKILQYTPVGVSVTVEDKFWEFMNEAEKIAFINKNEPNIEIIRTPAAATNTAPATVDENGNAVEAPTAPTVDENIKSMKVSEINRILSIVKKFNSGQLTIEQAKQLLAGYGLNEEQQTAWLNPNPVEL